MKKKARLIYNPTSGHEAIKRDLIDILNIYEKAGYETSTYPTTAKPHSASIEARRVAKVGYDLIIAAGGDGTINDVINGIADLPNRPKVSILPSGTTNDYARALQIPRDDLIDAASVVLAKHSMKLDIGEIRKDDQVRYFMNIAAVGTLSEVTYGVPSEMKSLYGYLAYLVKGAELVTRLQAVNTKIVFDDETFIGQTSMIFLALTNSVGGFEQIVPDAKLDDGKFTLLIVKSTSVPEILSLIGKVLKGGQHVDDPNVIYRKAEQVTIYANDNQQLKVNIDGEYGGDAPMTFSNLQQHIEFITPKTLK